MGAKLVKLLASFVPKKKLGKKLGILVQLLSHVSRGPHAKCEGDDYEQPVVGHDVSFRSVCFPMIIA